MVMTPEEIAQAALLQQQQGIQAQSGISQAHQNLLLEGQEKGMIKEQLDLGEELERIEHLLRGHILEDKGNGVRGWAEPDDKNLVVLSEYGIHLVLNTITWYINKNTLLSNYSEEVINQKMEDFASDLNDTIFMEYEKVFQYPTFEDCKKVLEDRIEKKKELKKFALELVGKEPNDEEIEKELLEEVENKVEKEIQKIKEQIIKGKLKRFLILIRTIQDSIHSTYNRAYKGEERRTLREHIHLSEIKGTSIPHQQKGGGVFGWLKG